MKLKELIAISLLGTILFLLQIVLAPLPNIELISLLVILYTLIYQKRVFYIVYLFAILEGVFYGFGVWWVMYLYVWPLLVCLVLFLQRWDTFWLWVLLSAFFGLTFGALCSIPYFLTGGWAMGISYWISGIPFDLLHGVSNFVVAFALFRPLRKLLTKLQK